MKKIQIVLFLALMVISCEKDNDTTIKSDLSRLDYFINEGADGIEVIKTDYTYKGQKLSMAETLIKDDNNNWTVVGKHEYAYSQDVITETIFEMVDQKWIAYLGSKIKVQNNRMIEVLEYEIIDEREVPYLKTEFAYKETGLSSWIEYQYDSDIPYPDEKGELIRTGDLINEHIKYKVTSGVESFSVKQIPIYSGGMITSYTNYRFVQSAWNESTKWEYEYSNDLVDVSRLMDWDDVDSSWVEERTYTYSYENKKLAKTSISDGTSIEYKYENGTSNNELIFNWPNILFDVEPNPY